MKRGAVAALGIVAAFTLAGCAAADAGRIDSPARSAVFDRAESSVDALPGASLTTEPGAISRYVGEDSAGDRYWAVWGPTDVACIVQEQVSGTEEVLQFCGGQRMSGSDARGVVMEFATAPVTLDPATAELIGETLLVQRP